MLFAIDIDIRNVKKQKKSVRRYAIEAAQREESIPLLAERRDFNRCVVADLLHHISKLARGKRYFIVPPKELDRVKRNHRGETNK